MDASASAAGGAAPFLLKTYDMIDDAATDEIVSWSEGKNSFVVWDPLEFARLLLPTYFKHSNFSSFIRQLNTYGFRKIDPERWEFANEGFMKDQKHLLKNIHRRKPIHSHSNHPGTVVDPERAAFEEEIERLSRDKASLEAKVLSYRHQRSAEKVQLQDMMQQVGGMEQRQQKLMTLLQRAVKDPSFVEHLARKVESMDFLAYKKKRRLPQDEHAQPVAENSSVEESDGHLSCQLNLTLASSSLQVNRSPYVSNGPQIGRETGRSAESKFSNDNIGVSSSQEALNSNQGSAAPPPVLVNDVFWEQFLTERPGSSDNEEASSNYRENPCEEQEDRRSGYGMSRSTRNMEQLTL